MKTTIEWLYNELSKNNISTDSVIERINKESSIWKQAKQMEKEQIIEASKNGISHGYTEGVVFGTNPRDYIVKWSEQYYNQTYKPETI